MNIFTLIFILIVFNLKSQTMDIMTYNIRYDNDYDTLNNWDLRKERVVELIKTYKPSILGIQEGLKNQVEFLDKNLEDYLFIGVGRDNGKDKGEYAAIFFNKKQVSLLSSNTFWLSETPQNISVGWDASQERICTYAEFSIKYNGKKIFVFNTHFDHKGDKARMESANLILSKIQDINKLKYPCILMGDFNAIEDEEPIKIIKSFFDDSRLISKEVHQGPKGTFNGFNTNNSIDKIDYIFTKYLKVNKHAHIDKRLDNGRHISDHLPVLINLNID